MDTNDKTAFLEKERIFPLLLKLGIPATVAMLVNALYNIVDTVFVGRGVGELAIAALSIVFPIQIIVSSLAQALGVGAASIVSRRLGEKRPEDAARAIGSAYASVFIATAAMSALLFVFLEPVLSFFGASAAIMPYAKSYTAIIAGGFFFFSMSMAASSLIRAEGNSRASMIGMLLGCALNCVLAPVFIFWFGWGVAGAASATVISQAASCAYLFGIYFRKRNSVAIRMRDIRVRWAELKESVVFGVPSFMQSAGLCIMALIINNTLGVYGGDRAITIYGMNTRFISLIVFPLIGVVQAFQPIVGYNFGARRFDRVKEAIRTSAAVMVGLALVFFALAQFVPELCLGVFTSDEELTKQAAGVLRLMMMFIPLVAIQFLGSAYFQAVGKKTESLVLGLVRQFILLIPMVVLLPRFFGVTGVWVSFPISDFASCVLTLVLLVLELKKLARAV